MRSGTGGFIPLRRTRAERRGAKPLDRETSGGVIGDIGAH